MPHMHAPLIHDSIHLHRKTCLITELCMVMKQMAQYSKIPHERCILKRPCYITTCMFNIPLMRDHPLI